MIIDSTSSSIDIEACSSEDTHPSRDCTFTKDLFSDATVCTTRVMICSRVSPRCVLKPKKDSHLDDAFHEQRAWGTKRAIQLLAGCRPYTHLQRLRTCELSAFAETQKRSIYLEWSALLLIRQFVILDEHYLNRRVFPLFLRCDQSTTWAGRPYPQRTRTGRSCQLSVM